MKDLSCILEASLFIMSWRVATEQFKVDISKIFSKDMLQKNAQLMIWISHDT